MEQNGYWEPMIEIAERPVLLQLQLQRLRQAVGQAARSPFYGESFRKLGISASSIRTLDDVRRLPFTAKEDLRGHFPYGLLSIPKEECVRLHCSSGTTGNPTVIFHNRHDLESWANLVARSMFAAGARPGDVFQNICGYGLFTGGLGFQYGAEYLGCLTIPAGAGNTKRQIKLIEDYGTSVIHAIPSYLPRLFDGFVEAGIKVGDTKLRVICTGAEPHSEETRQRLQALFGIGVFNSYGLSEMNGPGVAFECVHQAGMHLWEDCFLMEVINPKTLEPVPDGEVGELVLTTLDRQAMPILRYRTRDLTRIIPGPCACGRTCRRIDRISGRSDDMFIIRGCNVFPMQIEKILMRFPEVAGDYLIELVSRDDNDDIVIKVEINPTLLSLDNYGALEKLISHITHEIRNEILVTPIVHLVEHESLPRSEGKAQRVIDRRKLV
jgi:phenylacetate-CoA ligase